MKILAIDTATSACSAALSVEGGLVASRFEAMARGQSETLMPMIEEVLGEAALEPAELDLIAVTIGPGAFTGLRIGVAAARGVAAALGIPAVGVTTTEAVAAAAVRQAAPPDTLVAILESRRTGFFVQIFDRDGARVSEPAATEPADLAAEIAGLVDREPVFLSGDGAERGRFELERAGVSVSGVAAIACPDARDVAAITWRMHRNGEPLPAAEPLYLRAPDAEKPKHGGRLRP